MIGEERIRVSASADEVTVTINSSTEVMTLYGASPAKTGQPGVADRLYQLEPSDREGEFILTLEFEHASDTDGDGAGDRHGERSGERTYLRRFDAHLRNVSVRIRDDEYVLEGTLTAWVGYTNAFGVSLN